MLDRKGVGHTEKQPGETGAHTVPTLVQLLKYASRLAHTAPTLVQLLMYASHQSFFPAAYCVQGQIH